MRIVIPNHTTPDSFEENVAHCLREMGHDVLTMPARTNTWINSPLVRHSKGLWQKLHPVGIKPHERWLLGSIRSQRFDMILCLTQSLSEEVLAECRSRGITHRVAWWGDTPGNMQGMGLLTAEWDRIFIKDPHGVAKLRRIGLNAQLLHEAMNPTWHRPLAQQRNDEIVIAGTFYGYRQALTSILIVNGVEVGLYGGRLPLWIKPEIRQRHQRKFLVREEKSLIFGEGLACLNSTTMSEGNAMNCRAFEIAGAGGLQLLENRSIVTECFEPGKELLVFDSVEELLELIARAKREPAWAKRIREAGASRALAHHTYRHRLENIFKSLAS